MGTEPKRLHVFVSYADEDRALAEKITDELTRAFVGTVKITFAAEIPLGDKWRELLDQALDDADIFLVVATGRQKLSHSFSGSEIGYFRASRKYRPKMNNFDCDRIIIPLAIFTHVPEPARDFQGLEIDETFTPLVIEQAALKDDQILLKNYATIAENNPMLRLFERVYDIISQTYNFSRRDQEAYTQQMGESSRRLFEFILKELRQRISTEVFPERKIIIRLPNSEVKTQPSTPLDATISFYGRPFEIFGFSPSNREVPFQDFIASIPDSKLATAWTDTICSLVMAARSQDFGENRRLLTSSDGTKFFRLFVARDILYFSGINEIHIYIVEVKLREYGDPVTSMLLKAISVGLQYRFMFLEPQSEFSPTVFRLTLLQDLKSKVSLLAQELDYLLWYSQNAALGEPGNLLIIYGKDGLDDIDDRAALWEAQKASLTQTAYALLGASSDQLGSQKQMFLKVLTQFCEMTKDMNTQFTSKVLNALGKIVTDQI